MTAARSRRAPANHEARRIAHLAHVNMRLRTMYGLEVDGAEFDRISALFRSGKVATGKPDHYGRVWGWVDVRGTLVCACYSRTAGCVTTAMPPPPPRPEPKAVPVVATRASSPREVTMAAKAQAENIVRQALANGAALRGDVAWLKARANDVGCLIRMGQPLAASLLADAVCSMPRNVFPSVDPAASEAALQQRVASEVDGLLAALDAEREQNTHSTLIADLGGDGV